MVNAHLEDGEGDGRNDFIVRIIGFEDGKWIELAQDRMQWRALILVVLNFRALKPQC